MVQRRFQDIPSNLTSEAERTAFLDGLLWYTGLTWDQVLQSKRVLIIAEAGAGKTYECRQMHEMLWNSGEASFFIELAQLAQTSLHDLLAPEEQVRLERWVNAQAETATFFLDSFDELKLTRRSFERALKNLANSVRSKLQHIRIVLTSRPIPFDEALFRRWLPIPREPETAPSAEAFADIVTNRGSKKPTQDDRAPDWRSIALQPLHDGAMRDMIISRGIPDPDVLIEAIRHRNAMDFARRPQDLIELCADWRDHKRIRTHRDQVDSNIRIKLEPRTDRLEGAELSPDKARDGARRLALAATLTRKLTIRHSAEADRDGEANNAPLDPAAILHDWTLAERKTLLERPLFGFSSYGRVRFHHRSIIEFLCAEQIDCLLKQGLPVRTAKRLLFAKTAQGADVVKPSLRPVAAWLASSLPWVFSEVLAREPDVLLSYGDPEALPVAQRAAALRAYAARYGLGGWRGLSLPSVQARRFASPELAPLVREIWESGVENDEVRKILLDLIGHAQMTTCADIAYQASINPTLGLGERIAALNALIALKDARLAELAAAIPEDAATWPKKLVKYAVLELFPDYLSAGQLCQTLKRVSEPRHAIGDLSWQLPRLIREAPLSQAQLAQLHRSLAELILGGSRWDENHWPYARTEHQLAVPALAAACARAWGDAASDPDVVHSSIIALRFKDRDDDRCEHAKDLTELIASAGPGLRQIAFETDEALLQQMKPETCPRKRYWRMGMARPAVGLTPADLGWLRKALADQSRPADDRAMLAETAIRCRDDGVAFADHIGELLPLVADLPDLAAYLEDWKRPKEPDPQHADMMRRNAASIERHRQKEAKRHSSWAEFWTFLAENVETAFQPDHAESTIWNLWKAMEASGAESRSSGWSRQFIESQFGHEVANKLRLALMAFWRTVTPTLWSERAEDERNIFYHSWRLGLAGLAAEAEDRDWAAKLSRDEIDRALRYVPVEWNGFPSWMMDIERIAPGAIDAILGTELEAQLTHPGGDTQGMLQDIKYAGPTIASLFVGRLFQWLTSDGWRHATNEPANRRLSRLTDVVSILTAHGDEDMKQKIAIIAATELAKDLPDEFIQIWLPTLMRLRPLDGLEALEAVIRGSEPSQYGPAVTYLGKMFGDDHSKMAINLSELRLPPDDLFRLLRLAYTYVRREDDLVHDGTYSPDVRDHAERARSAILKSILDLTGSEGWAVKVELANDPLFADFRDRALALALERTAEEADAGVSAESEIAALCRCYDLPAKSRGDMAALMRDRLDDLAELLLQDGSPRAAWALIKDEQIMRQQIALQLEQASRGAYLVVQEAVTADGKETDLRLQSTGSAQEGVIELKLGDKGRSGADLLAAMHDQLVVKYMAPETRKVGCLLVTINEHRTWEHPQTKVRMEFDELIGWLNDEADVISENLGRSIDLFASGLDLRRRLRIEQRDRKRNGAGSAG